MRVSIKKEATSAKLESVSSIASNGLDCGSCSKAQRRKCKEDYLYSECPKAIKLESLNKPIIDSEGHTTELGELIADDKALDLGAWLDAKTFLLGFPQRLLAIAHKLDNGDVLTVTRPPLI
jgi:hypothetical protein